MVVVVSCATRERERQEEWSAKERRERERVSHRVLFLSVQRDEERSEERRARGSPRFMISGRHYYGDGVAASPNLFSFSQRDPAGLSPGYFKREIKEVRSKWSKIERR